MMAGVVNIVGAKYLSHIFKLKTTTLEPMVNDAEITWFPAFRSNTEVAQITEGHSMRRVFFSSTKIKLYASAGAAVYALVIPFLIDIQALKNDEGFLGLGAIALINFIIGGKKIYDHTKQKPLP